MLKMTKKAYQNRFLIPAILLVLIALGGLGAFLPSLRAQASPPSTQKAVSVSGVTDKAVPVSTQQARNVGNVASAASSSSPVLPGGKSSKQSTKEKCTYDRKGLTSSFNSGNPSRSSFIKCAGGKLIAYGDSAIVYKNPPASYIAVGKSLFALNCAACHGSQAEGTAVGPNLQGVGAATVDFWVSTGRMPASDIPAVEAERKPPRLNSTQALEVAAYVNSLFPSTPAVPTPNLKGANLSEGQSLFALNCAACHTITGAGDALAFSTNAPTLHAATPQQIAEAIRTGPANMPRFTGNLSDNQVRDVVAYVSEKIQHPSDPGGAGLGGIGPVAEGFVALLLGVGGLMLVAFWIGDRS